MSYSRVMLNIYARTNGMDDPIVVLYRKLKQQGRRHYENVT